MNTSSTQESTSTQLSSSPPPPSSSILLKQSTRRKRNSSSTASSSSDSDDDCDEDQQQPAGWRVKLYRLNQDGSWDDCGTGRILCLHENSIQSSNSINSSNKKPKNWFQQQQQQQSDCATLCVQAEVVKGSSQQQLQHQPRVLLRTRILLQDAYQRQGDNIITWCEPCYYNSDSSVTSAEQGVDLALSFQDNAGCLEIWQQIIAVQGRRVEEVAAAAAAQHHADVQERLQHWDSLQQQHHQNQQDAPNDVITTALPSPPSLQTLDEIADTIAAFQHVQQRESLTLYIAGDDCLYLKQLLALFPAAEARGDYGKLATLAACVKTVLLLNDPSILELIVMAADIFEQVCSCLEYDPDLREKANHRWFLRERAKFRTVVPMDDPELIQAIHRSFRVQYLRDTLLRPTMDESSLSTLSSLQTFTHADVIKGVTMSSGAAGNDKEAKDSYLVRVIRLLGVELYALMYKDWADLESSTGLHTIEVTTDASNNDSLATSGRKETLAAIGETLTGRPPDKQPLHWVAPPVIDPINPDPSIIVGGDATTRKQYLTPQDWSLEARRLRRRGCLSFLRELFQMVRQSLQQCDKDDFFSVICTLEVFLSGDREISDNVSQTSQLVEVGSVASTVRSDRVDEKADDINKLLHAAEAGTPASANLLSMLANILLDPNSDTTEKSAVLEILVGVAMHDPSLIRRHCLDCHHTWKNERPIGTSDLVLFRPEANDKRQVVFLGPPDDLLSALIFLLIVETDAGALLQVSEIMRIILDTDIMGDHGPISQSFIDEAEGIPPCNGVSPLHDQRNQTSSSDATSSNQKCFLSIFYEHYMEWLVAPFQFTILHPTRRIPDRVLSAPSESVLFRRFLKTLQKGIHGDEAWLRTVPVCAVRTSFTVELLSFCVRAHLCRMKLFLLKSRVIGNVLNLLRPQPLGISGDRCLKLAALRFLRAVLSVNDEFYHRHIIQHNLFDSVFEAFRANPVGDNLVSSAIVEMCDYIHSENIKSLLEYIVTKHLSIKDPCNNALSLEDVSSPYVSTLTTLRKAYEANLEASLRKQESDKGQSSPGGSRYFPGGLHHAPRRLSGKALEDQRKFREVDDDESYFEMDDDGPYSGVSAVADELQREEKESDLHRTPRMFSLAQAPFVDYIHETSKERFMVSDHKGQDSSEANEQQHDSELATVNKGTRRAVATHLSNHTPSSN